MGLGFEYLERLSGSYRRDDPDAQDVPMTLVLRISFDTIGGLIATRSASLTGHIRAVGLSTVGTVFGRVVIERGPEIIYDLVFSDDAGRTLRLVAKKRGLSADPYAGLTTLQGTVEDDRGTLVASVLLRFDPRADRGGLLSSFRLRL